MKEKKIVSAFSWHGFSDRFPIASTWTQSGAILPEWKMLPDPHKVAVFMQGTPCSWLGKGGREGTLEVSVACGMRVMKWRKVLREGLRYFYCHAASKMDTSSNSKCN